MKLYLKYLIMQLKSDLEYRKSFVISVVSKTASSIFAFISIFFLFDKNFSLSKFFYT